MQLIITHFIQSYNFSNCIKGIQAQTKFKEINTTDTGTSKQIQKQTLVA
jgi:hypothetical protein